MGKKDLLGKRSWPGVYRICDVLWWKFKHLFKYPWYTEKVRSGRPKCLVGTSPWISWIWWKIQFLYIIWPYNPIFSGKKWSFGAYKNRFIRFWTIYKRNYFKCYQWHIRIPDLWQIREPDNQWDVLGRLCFYGHWQYDYDDQYQDILLPSQGSLRRLSFLQRVSCKIWYSRKY